MKPLSRSAYVAAFTLAISTPAFAQTGGRLETRFLAQTTSGSGPTYVVNNASSLSFAAGSTVRLTVQFRMVDTSNPPASIRGLARSDFIISATGPAGGTAQRSILTGFFDPNEVLPSRGEANGLPNRPGVDTYPDFNGANADAFTGLHCVHRNFLTVDPDGSGPLTVDADPLNGVFSGREVTGIRANCASGTVYPSNSGGLWFGLYSFEFVNSGAIGDITFGFAPLVTAQRPNGSFLYFRNQNPVESTSFLNGSITLSFVPAPASALGLLLLIACPRRRRPTRAAERR